MRTILVDDEYYALEELEYFLGRYSHINVIGKYINPLEAIEEIKRKAPEAIFLDIKMPELGGFNVAEEILSFNENIKIIFASAYDEYAIKAFEINALDYVLKPFCRERLDITVQRLMENSAVLNRSAIRQQAAMKGLKKVPIWKEDKVLLINLSDICYFMSCEKEVKVVTRNQAVLRSSNTLSSWEERLADQKFFRCHRSFLVNLNLVEEIIPTFQNTYELKLKGIQDRIPVSRTCFYNLKNLLGF